MRWNSFHDNSFTKSPSTDVPRAVSTVNGFDYQKFDRAVTWQEANATCIELGGILAMDTPEVHDFFAGLGKPELRQGLARHGVAWLRHMGGYGVILLVAHAIFHAP